jgi:hypothetical protein
MGAAHAAAHAAALSLRAAAPVDAPARTLLFSFIPRDGIVRVKVARRRMKTLGGCTERSLCM